ncbi:hypothetical protein FJY69_00755, partial [candidate division WOR-3 bacterium]|nr:hypothetical protein [candidate division WOR-3 bacterium]
MKNLLVCLSALASFGFARPSSHYSMGPARAFTPTPGNEVTEISFSNGFVVDTRTGESSIPDALRLPDFQPGPAYYIVQFNGPIRQQWSRELSRLGVRPFGYLPSYAVLAKLDPAQRVAVQALPMVRWVGLFQPAYKVQDVLLGASGTVKLVIVVTPGEEHRPILDVLADCGAPYADVAESDFCTSITVTVPASAIAAIAQLQEVVWVQLWTEPEFCNSNCQWVVQTGWRSTAPPDTSMTARRVWANGVRGQRVILSTTDSGLNMGHDLFRDPALSVTAPGIWPTHRKVVAFKLYPGAHQGEAPYHGSHVNGTAAGDDSVTGGTSYHDGMSIKGRLYFVDISNSSGGLVTGTDLTELWDSVYLGRGLPDSLRPIRQHSGSWGWSNSSGTYLLQDATTDNYSWVRKDFLNIMAAANSGPGARTVANPGLAKNVITVGATQNGTSSNAIASFSSRGPTADNRLKPTLCAPGVALYSATASGSSTYQSMNGTSMATPAVNGTVGLMRCYLRQGYYPSGAANPADSISYISAALLRSMAVASADPNIGSYTVPDFNIGWGRIDADSVLFFAGDLRKLIVKDDTSGVATGQFKEEQFVVNSSIPLRIALAWTDTAAAPSAARALVNNLNLEVVAPGGTVYRGNQYSGGQSVSNPTIWDTLNVEECVRVNSPATGVWTIRVYGFQVATAARQPFAYTITGDISKDFRDVGVRRIMAPTGMVDSGSIVTPACSVANYGSSSETYTVRMRIGSGYNQTATVTNHPAGTRRYVTFPTWTALARGTHMVSCSTELVGDGYPANDRQTDSVVVRVRDVGCRALLAPSGTVDSGSVTVPACTVYNYGSGAVSYNVRMRIGTGYNNTAAVTNHAGGTALYVTFPSWTANLARGTYAVTCSTELSGDIVPANDRRTGTVTIRVLDAATVALLAPSGVVDSGAVVIPACTVANRGTQSATYTVRMRIGTTYNQAVAVSAQPPGAKQYLTFPAWTAEQVVVHAVSCSTELSGDLAQANDKLTGSVTVRPRDVSCTRILVPTGTLDSATTVVPSCSVVNYSGVAVSYTVRMKVGATYNQAVAVNNHPAGTRRYVTFPAWTANVARGGHAVSCSTELAGDANPANDRSTTQIDIRVRDVACQNLLAPSGTIDSGSVVVPSCSSYNHGSVASSYTVRMRIGSGYSSPVTVLNHSAGASRYVTFPSWTANERGSLAVSCSTELSGDLNEANNRQSGQVMVVVRDVGCVALVAPAGIVDSGTTVTPICTVANFSTTAETYAVRMRIGSGYSQTVTVTNQAPLTRQQVTFPDWTAHEPGVLAVSCSTELAGDANQANNRRTGSVDVRVRDVGCVVLVAPAGTVDSGAAVTPACTVANFGNGAETYTVRMRIGSGYDRTATVTSHPAGTRRYVTFPTWTALTRGTNAVSCSTELAGDVRPGNDQVTGLVDVRVRDVGAASVLAPSGTLDSGTVVTPVCTVANFG